ncbi:MULTISPECIES: hypothetical protein [Paraburkholderia]|uniref:hypothetical protein n=1 Tax=Paraburkholderia TaxID=1822464 RepID=UPI00225B3723|nr:MULTISPECIES: hypothetical protein [Paraburkholderia]MCX4170684.1 hypothetical protein [Paraburkholderia madseniana]MDQ6458696.1 hypothetical protein [Paraburkholderia madseniana]
MNFATNEEIRAARTSDLVIFHNANVPEGEQVKRFRDRAAAESKCVGIIEAQEAAKGAAGWTRIEASAEIVPDTAVEAAVGTLAQPEASGEQAAPESNPLGPWPFPKNPEGVEFTPVVLDRPRGNNSLAVAASWADAEVYAARLTRHGVTVTFNGKTTEHRSVREAFRHYRLPDAKHIRFRLGLKASGCEVFEHEGRMYAFTLVEIAPAGVEAEKAE